MAEISARLTEVAWERLQDLSRAEGISIRSAFEAGFLCFLELDELEDPSPAQRRLRDAAWTVAARLDAEAATGRMERRKVNIRLEEELLTRVKAACAARGVSISGLAAATFTPWGSWWGGAEEFAAREVLWARSVEIARRMDYRRRTGRAEDCPQDDPAPLA